MVLQCLHQHGSVDVLFPYALATIRLDCVLNPWDIRCGRQCVTRVSILNDFSRILRLAFTRFPPVLIFYTFSLDVQH